ncbi:Tfp pilus assembly protein FimT/FimU [Pseudomonas aeruginosa]|uniref:pilus assembly FimT family protein n=1 Tax=Pseudomonas aeruginosa TaxID=287 RepID=UPI002111B267|nr:hypothetical protein [Pseudomonas aeruginosa]MCT9629157.1 hypothetical protein [Pseudomonas aeruginosa]
MVIVVLLAVMVAFAVPSFVGLIKGNSMASARNDLQKSLDYARAMAMTNKAGAQVCVADGVITISQADKAERFIARERTGSNNVKIVEYGYKYEWAVVSKLSSSEYKTIGSNGLESGCVVFANNGTIPALAKRKTPLWGRMESAVRVVEGVRSYTRMDFSESLRELQVQSGRLYLIALASIR